MQHPVSQPVSQSPVVRLLRVRQVVELTGLSKSTLDRLVRAREFPPPLRLTRRCTAWPEPSVAGWIATKIAAGTEGREPRTLVPGFPVIPLRRRTGAGAASGA